jgi:poly(hydroxyalkanoate) depolymerase family esterase
MNDNFVAEILRATNGLRSGDPAGATAIIQAALAAGGLTGSAPLGGQPWNAFSAGGPGVIEGSVSPDGANAARPGVAPSPRLRKPLGEVLRTLSEGRKGLGLLDGVMPSQGLPAARGPDLPLPEGAEFLDLSFSCAAGTRRYRLYVPASAGDDFQGMIVMLHGCTQTPEDFAAGTRMNALAEEHRLLIVYPGQTRGDNSMSCWNWFRPGDQLREGGEPEILAGLTRGLRDQYKVPADRVFVAGLSAGGAMAAILAETHPDLYAAIGVHSGLAAGSANDVMSAFSAMHGQGGLAGRAVRRGDQPRPRVIVFHGDADTTVHPANAERIIAGEGGQLAAMERTDHPASGTGRAHSRRVTRGADGTRALEFWAIAGAGHAWAGGDPRGSYTDPQGPDASAAMVRFFLGADAERN